MKTVTLVDPSQADFFQALNQIDPLFPAILGKSAWDACSVWIHGYLSNPSGLYMTWAWENGKHTVVIWKS